MFDVFFSVLAILGIIVVGGFVVVFLGNLLLTVLSGESSIKSAKEQPEPQQITYIQPQLEQVIEPISEDFAVNDFEDVDIEKANEEEYNINNEQNTRESELSDAFAKLKAEEEAFRAERLKFIEERKQSVLAEKELESENKEDEDYEINLDDIFFEEEDDSEEINEEIVEEFDKVTEEPENVEENEELDISNERVAELEEELFRQREELSAFKRFAEEEKTKLIQEKEEALLKAQVVVSEKSEANLTIEEYEARLATLEERLKQNEKNLKAVKKEYLPLARVRKSLENDKRKLRRREALVAKQKVILYGVNNYVDIDEEKAKKLAEDLDLLDGLRVSVQHCEEVMKNNSERMPILENSYNVLTANNVNIKSDIEEVLAKIEILKGNK